MPNALRPSLSARLRCPLCHERFAAEEPRIPLLRCRSCGTIAHEACRRELGPCSTLGCRQSQGARQSPAPDASLPAPGTHSSPTRSPLSPSPRPLLSLSLLVLSLGGLAALGWWRSDDPPVAEGCRLPRPATHKELTEEATLSYLDVLRAQRAGQPPDVIEERRQEAIRRLRAATQALNRFLDPQRDTGGLSESLSASSEELDLQHLAHCLIELEQDPR